MKIAVYDICSFFSGRTRKLRNIRSSWLTSSGEFDRTVMKLRAQLLYTAGNMQHDVKYIQ